MIPKVTLKDLWRTTMRRSSLITIPDLIEFFKFNNEFTEYEVFYSIVRDALDKFHYYYPLYRQQRAYLKVDSNYRARISSNFEGYLKGLVDESQIILMPSAVIGLSAQPATGFTYPYRSFHYEVGEFSDFFYQSANWYMACICNRPFPEDFDENGVPTDNCAVWWMNKDTDPEYKTFKDQVYVELCRYIWNMKQNMQLTNLPIEVFQGLYEESQRVQSDLDRIYEQALTASPWIM